MERGLLEYNELLKLVSHTATLIPDFQTVNINPSTDGVAKIVSTIPLDPIVTISFTRDCLVDGFDQSTRHGEDLHLHIQVSTRTVVLEEK